MKIENEVIFKCTIPGRPGIKKNGKKICRNPKTGRVFVKSSDAYESWELYACAIIMRAKSKDTVTVPVNAKMVFYFKNHAHESDLSNNYQGIEDILQKCEVIQDDKLIYSHDGSRKVFGDVNERCEIEITLAA